MFIWWPEGQLDQSLAWLTVAGGNKAWSGHYWPQAACSLQHMLFAAHACACCFRQRRILVHKIRADRMLEGGHTHHGMIANAHVYIAHLDEICSLIHGTCTCTCMYSQMWQSAALNPLTQFVPWCNAHKGFQALEVFDDRHQSASQAEHEMQTVTPTTQVLSRYPLIRANSSLGNSQPQTLTQNHNMTLSCWLLSLVKRLTLQAVTSFQLSTHTN